MRFALNKKNLHKFNVGPISKCITELVFYFIFSRKRRKQKQNKIVWLDKQTEKNSEYMIFIFGFVCRKRERERERVNIFAINFTILDKLREELCHTQKIWKKNWLDHIRWKLNSRIILFERQKQTLYQFILEKLSKYWKTQPKVNGKRIDTEWNDKKN